VLTTIAVYALILPAIILVPQRFPAMFGCKINRGSRGHYTRGIDAAMTLVIMSLDVLSIIAAVDEGSFSAAGRKLRRAQSVVSQTLANLEGQIGVKLFDRKGRLPVLTEQGRALLAHARAVVGDMDLLKAHAKGLAGGLEPDLSGPAGRWFINCLKHHSDAPLAQRAVRHPSASGKRRKMR
jgi:Bacterial regulatory helix-turn-helix protein, lysR family